MEETVREITKKRDGTRDTRKKETYGEVIQRLEKRLDEIRRTEDRQRRKAEAARRGDGRELRIIQLAEEMEQTLKDRARRLAELDAAERAMFHKQNRELLKQRISPSSLGMDTVPSGSFSYPGPFSMHSGEDGKVVLELGSCYDYCESLVRRTVSTPGKTFREAVEVLEPKASDAESDYYEEDLTGDADLALSLSWCASQIGEKALAAKLGEIAMRLQSAHSQK